MKNEFLYSYKQLSQKLEMGNIVGIGNLIYNKFTLKFSVGLQISEKQKLISRIVIEKIHSSYINFKENINALYVDTELMISPNYIQTLTSIYDREIKNLLEKSLLIYRTVQTNDLLNLFESELEKLLDQEKSGFNIKIIVFDNLSTFLSTKFHGKHAPHKKYIQDLFRIARNKNILVILISNLKNVKFGDEYYLEPEIYEQMEYMTSVYLIESIYIDSFKIINLK